MVLPFKALVQSRNMLLIVFPIVRFLGLAEDVGVVLCELVQVFLANVTVLVDCPLQAPCPLPVPVVLDGEDYLNTLGVFQLRGDKLPGIMKIHRFWRLHRITAFVHVLASILIIQHVLARIGLARSIFRCLGLARTATQRRPLLVLAL